MREFYVWTKRNPYYRGPMELDDALKLAGDSCYISPKQCELIKREYAEGSRYNWQFVYGFNESAHITAYLPKTGGTF
jgi:hypothetical protein